MTAAGNGIRSDARIDVRGITNGPLPDGKESLPIGGAGDFGGVTRLTQTWLAA